MWACRGYHPKQRDLVRDTRTRICCAVTRSPSRTLPRAFHAPAGATGSLGRTGDEDGAEILAFLARCFDPKR